MGKRRSRRQPEVESFLPDGEMYLIIAYVAEGSDFTLAEAVTRLQAALAGRVMRAFPCRRDRRVLEPMGLDLMVGFYIQAAPSDASEPPPVTAQEWGDTPAGSCAAVRRACEVLSGFRGVWAFDSGGKAKVSSG